MVQGIDSARLELLRNNFESIADEMALTVHRTSRSAVVRTSHDFSTGLLSPLGELVAQGISNPGHLGGMAPALRACLTWFEGRVYPGDILINNDPYEGGSHLPDIFVFKPLFDGDTLIAWLCTMSHHTDVGGRVPGGNACDSTEIYQEGIRIPPLKLYDRGQPSETLFRLLEKAVRVPDLVLGDLKAQVAGLFYGEREYGKLVRKYGIEPLLAYQNELLDYSERLTRQGIRSFPDGSWSFTDYIDDDGFDPGPIKIVVNLTKKDDSIHVDFSGTSPQARGAINPPLVSVKAICYAVLRCVLNAVGIDPPNTGGYFRPMTVSALEGSFTNPVLPAPVAARAIGMFRTAQAVFGAFAQMLPDKILASSGGCELGIAMAGYDKSKTPWKPWVQLEFHNEQGWGGRPDKDGIDGQTAHMLNMANIPAEELEMEQPLQVLQYSFDSNTEGAGKFRGAMGMVRSYKFLMDETLIQMRAERMKYQPYGLNGGMSPPPTRIFLTQDGQTTKMSSKFIDTVSKGDTLEVRWPGAGGWGPPKERDPRLVLEDIIAEKITAEHARDIYGVVTDPRRRSIDWDDTRRLRL